MKKLIPLNFTLLVLSLIIFSCKKEEKIPDNVYEVTVPNHVNLPDSTGTNPVIAVNLKLYGDIISPVVPDDFLGFSFEKLILTDTTYFNTSNTSFINLYKNLGGGLIRIGGATVDKIFWSKNRRNSSNRDTVYSNDVDRVLAFNKMVGWKTIWGLNLGKLDPTSDVQEANYVLSKSGNLIHSFAIGNEPEYFSLNNLRKASYSYNVFQGEFTDFSNSLRNSVPGIVISGPEANDGNWCKQFLNNTNNNINLFSFHYYRMGPAGSTSVTMNKLMTFDQFLHDIIAYLKPAVNVHNKVLFRFSECNSVYHGGQPGISNAFGSSLWGSEFLFYLAQQGIAGVNFHTGAEKAVYVYSPINTVDKKNVARPLYYAMLLFHQAAVKQFLKTDLQSTNANIDAFSFTRKDGKNGILIVNKDDKNDVSLTINNKDVINSTTIYQLNGPSLSSTSGTNINGAFVDDNGVFKSDGYVTNLSAPSSFIKIKTKAATALLVVFN
ncbi:Glycosyl hydrolase family 79, N-terminal domain [Mucilaginibacter sp. OK268]|uniref:hypothetical protein n=1 Tax=Mucilaginibacter sp. OK268 TaxID=1881048 RepID=UPI000881AA75|nr:hypothetical protein [Mucilaginibacter sp. OK268]SDQ00117.1 Glycosyl hydrolase family 79, N-terminal domain [Mucilaginibacter sp. OK268]